MSNKVLTPRQMELYALLDGKGDVPIRDLYRDYYGRDPEKKGLTRTAQIQAAMGWPIVTLNSRLRGMKKRVVPGIARGTYRLANTSR